MKKLLTGLCCLMAMALQAGDKVADSSGKEPKWIYGMQEDYLIVSAESADLEEARNKAMLQIKKQILNSIAENVKSEAVMVNEEAEQNGRFEMASLYVSKVESKSANIPFLNEISANKATDWYWEKIKRNKEYFYRYHIKYPFSQFDLMRMVDDFKTREAQLDNTVQDFLNDDFSSYTSIEEMQQRVTELKVFQSSLMEEDSRRKTCGTILDAYNKFLQSISLRAVSITQSELVFAPYFGENRLTTTQKPQLKTNCLTELAYSNTNGLCQVTYNYETACYPDEQNWLEVSLKAGTKKITNKFYIK